MAVRPATLIKVTALAAALALGGCGPSDEAELARIDNSIVGNDTDPALTSALEDQIMVDPALTQQSNSLAVRRPGGPVQAQYPTSPEAQAEAMSDLAQGRGAACGSGLDYNRGWAERLPAAFGIFPGGRLNEAAGSNEGDCRIRVVTYSAPAPAERILNWHQAMATRAGYSAEQMRREGEHILAGVNGEAAYYLIVTPKGEASDVALIANNGR